MKEFFIPFLEVFCRSGNISKLKVKKGFNVEQGNFILMSHKFFLNLIPISAFNCHFIFFNDFSCHSINYSISGKRNKISQFLLPIISSSPFQIELCYSLIKPLKREILINFLKILCITQHFVNF